MTRGQCGSLLLHCVGLAPTIPCRSPGALGVDFLDPPRHWNTIGFGIDVSDLYQSRSRYFVAVDSSADRFEPTRTDKHRATGIRRVGFRIGVQPFIFRCGPKMTATVFAVRLATGKREGLRD